MWKAKTTAGEEWKENPSTPRNGAGNTLPHKIPQRHTTEFSCYGEEDRFIEKKTTPEVHGPPKPEAETDNRGYSTILQADKQVPSHKKQHSVSGAEARMCRETISELHVHRKELQISVGPLLLEH